MIIDKEKNKKFYNDFNMANENWCNCSYCNYYRDNILKNYKKLNSYLKDFGIDIRKPYESSIPFLDNDNKLVYPFAWYISFGNVDDDFHEKISGVDIKKALSFPKPIIDDEYFIIEIGPLILGDEADYLELEGL